MIGRLLIEVDEQTDQMNLQVLKLVLQKMACEKVRLNVCDFMVYHKKWQEILDDIYTFTGKRNKNLRNELRQQANEYLFIRNENIPCGNCCECFKFYRLEENATTLAETTLERIVR